MLNILRRWLKVSWRDALLNELYGLKRGDLPWGLIIGVPILQLLFFGFAVNGDPRHLPTGVLCAESGPFSRAVLAAMENTGYFKITGILASEDEAHRALSRGTMPLVLTIPPDFDRLVLRGERPALLLEADATDPLTVANALIAAGNLPAFALQHEALAKVISADPGGGPLFSIIIHKRYNPEGLTHYNIAPGLLGTILAMSLVMMTSMALIRMQQRSAIESGPEPTMENVAGKAVLYIIIGLVQSTLVILAARFIFHAPFVGNALLLYLAVLPFIVANVCAGIFLAWLAKSRAKAMQLSMAYFLPNMMLSGFMFPFLGMPEWAKAVGHLLPLTWFNRMARGILLKGNTFADIWPALWPLLLLMVPAIIAAALVSGSSKAKQ